MSTGENIRNAVHVLQKTYENISKMMEHSRSVADEAGYAVVSEKFLRWRTDGFFIIPLIIAQKRKDKIVKN